MVKAALNAKQGLRTKRAKSFWGWNDGGGERAWYQEMLDPTLTSSQWAGPHGLTGGASPFIDTIDRWYNPWSNSNRSTERGEEYLRVPGQIAMGTGAAAGIAAGGLAAAPALGLGGTGSATTAAGTVGTAAAGAQTPAGQNLLQRGAQMAQPVAQFMSQRVLPTANRAADTLNRINYAPQDVLHDAYALGTGNVDKIKGPGWGGALKPLGGPSLGLPAGSGAPGLGLPRPAGFALQANNMVNAGSQKLMHSMGFGGGSRPPAPAAPAPRPAAPAFNPRTGYAGPKPPSAPPSSPPPAQAPAQMARAPGPRR